jgi:hypothetical protein
VAKIAILPAVGHGVLAKALAKEDHHCGLSTKNFDLTSAMLVRKKRANSNVAASSKAPVLFAIGGVSSTVGAKLSDGADVGAGDIVGRKVGVKVGSVDGSAEIVGTNDGSSEGIVLGKGETKSTGQESGGGDALMTE